MLKKKRKEKKLLIKCKEIIDTSYNSVMGRIRKFWTTDLAS